VNKPSTITNRKKKKQTADRWNRIERGCRMVASRRRAPTAQTELEFVQIIPQRPQKGTKFANYVLEFCHELLFLYSEPTSASRNIRFMFANGQSKRMTDAPKKLLCIEDDRETATLIAEELVERGFEVNLAYDGREGLAAVLQKKPDLVLCDISMPALSGFEVLERLTALAPSFGDIPFIFLTALSDRDNELKGRQLGADDYVTKPIDFDMLSMIVNARLAGVARTEVWAKLVELHEREVETLTWVARGKTSAEIAQILGLTKRTVDFHLDNARVKLGATTRTQAAIKAATGRLIEI
jgi:DNA-binding NarL/FixJ family response regulator